jgi:hypothetical protein
MSMLHRIILSSALMALTASAHAIPITYTETVFGSGLIDGSSFINQLIKLTAVGDTVYAVSF